MASQDTIKAHQLRFQGSNWDQIMALSQFKDRSRRGLQKAVTNAITNGELEPLPKDIKVNKKQFDNLPSFGAGVVEPKKTESKKKRTIPQIIKTHSYNDMALFMESHPEVMENHKEFYKNTFVKGHLKWRSVVLEAIKIMKQMD